MDIEEKIVKKINERVKAIAEITEHALQDMYLAGYRDGYDEGIELLAYAEKNKAESKQ
jgi:flagellar biosynthesis/type III secretory pathway protein FliH